ncbi:hypothetical protein DFH08DRAFT_445808 [Mycena albidolilacea]|uniref:Uncharacterized protein n=1 Tax=Mycena albidolilacea TaxID=1033008 RepID=A0AAD6Z8W6_9AGAR|nr:hypothetical protein DFH08DRAFT_445808 [Mycena albidolilacea]
MTLGDSLVAHSIHGGNIQSSSQSVSLLGRASISRALKRKAVHLAARPDNLRDTQSAIRGSFIRLGQDFPRSWDRILEQIVRDCLTLTRNIWPEGRVFGELPALLREGDYLYRVNIRLARYSALLWGVGVVVGVLKSMTFRIRRTMSSQNSAHLAL